MALDEEELPQPPPRRRGKRVTSGKLGDFLAQKWEREDWRRGRELGSTELRKFLRRQGVSVLLTGS